MVIELILLCIFCLNSNVQGEQAIQLKEHQQWWEHNFEARGNDFARWLGDVNADSRLGMRRHVKKMGYESLLDVPSGLCVDYYGLKSENLASIYQGLDITPKLVARALELGIHVKQGSIENIPWNDSSFDIVYARHILEHLDYYTVALKELIRVAKKEALIVFFIKPTDQPDKINSAKDGSTQFDLLYHNHYNKAALERYISGFAKVNSLAWEHVNDQEVILHIYMKN